MFNNESIAIGKEQFQKIRQMFVDKGDQPVTKLASSADQQTRDKLVLLNQNNNNDDKCNGVQDDETRRSANEMRPPAVDARPRIDGNRLPDPDNKAGRIRFARTPPEVHNVYKTSEGSETSSTDISSSSSLRNSDGSMAEWRNSDTGSSEVPSLRETERMVLDEMASQTILGGEPRKEMSIEESKDKSGGRVLDDFLQEELSYYPDETSATEIKASLLRPKPTETPPTPRDEARPSSSFPGQAMTHSPALFVKTTARSRAWPFEEEGREQTESPGSVDFPTYKIIANETGDDSPVFQSRPTSLGETRRCHESDGWKLQTRKRNCGEDSNGRTFRGLDIARAEGEIWTTEETTTMDPRPRRPTTDDANKNPHELRVEDEKAEEQLSSSNQKYLKNVQNWLKRPVKLQQPQQCQRRRVKYEEYFSNNDDCEYPYDALTAQLPPEGQKFRRRFEILRKMPANGGLKVLPRVTTRNLPKPCDQPCPIPPPKTIAQRLTAVSDEDLPRSRAPTLFSTPAKKFERNSYERSRGGRSLNHARGDSTIEKVPTVEKCEERCNSNNNVHSSSGQTLAKERFQNVSRRIELTRSAASTARRSIQWLPSADETFQFTSSFLTPPPADPRTVEEIQFDQYLRDWAKQRLLGRYLDIAKSARDFSTCQSLSIGKNPAPKVRVSQRRIVTLKLADARDDRNDESRNGGSMTGNVTKSATAPQLRNPLANVEPLQSRLRRQLPERHLPFEKAETREEKKKREHFFGVPIFGERSKDNGVDIQKKSPLQKIKRKLSATVEKWKNRKKKPEQRIPSKIKIQETIPSEKKWTAAGRRASKWEKPRIIEENIVENKSKNPKGNRESNKSMTEVKNELQRNISVMEKTITSLVRGAGRQKTRLLEKDEPYQLPDIREANIPEKGLVRRDVKERVGKEEAGKMVTFVLDRHMETMSDQTNKNCDKALELERLKGVVDPWKQSGWEFDETEEPGKSNLTSGIAVCDGSAASLRIKDLPSESAVASVTTEIKSAKLWRDDHRKGERQSPTKPTSQPSSQPSSRPTSSPSRSTSRPTSSQSGRLERELHMDRMQRMLSRRNSANHLYAKYNIVREIESAPEPIGSDASKAVALPPTKDSDVVTAVFLPKSSNIEPVIEQSEINQVVAPSRSSGNINNEITRKTSNSTMGFPSIPTPVMNPSRGSNTGAATSWKDTMTAHPSSVMNYDKASAISLGECATACNFDVNKFAEKLKKEGKQVVGLHVSDELIIRTDERPERSSVFKSILNYFFGGGGGDGGIWRDIISVFCSQRPQTASSDRNTATDSFDDIRVTEPNSNRFLTLFRDAIWPGDVAGRPTTEISGLFLECHTTKATAGTSGDSYRYPPPPLRRPQTAPAGKGSRPNGIADTLRPSRSASVDKDANGGRTYTFFHATDAFGDRNRGHSVSEYTPMQNSGGGKLGTPGPQKWVVNYDDTSKTFLDNNNNDVHLGAINAKGFRLIQKAPSVSPADKVTQEETEACRDYATEFERRLQKNINRRPVPREELVEVCALVKAEREKEEANSEIAGGTQESKRWPKRVAPDDDGFIYCEETLYDLMGEFHE